MAKSKYRTKRKTGTKQPSRAKTVTVIGILGLIAVGFIAADPYVFLNSDKRSSDQNAPNATAGLTPSNPSKEYTYAGGRLVTTEEPVGPSIAALNPATVVAATSNNFPLIVTGSGFQTDSTVRINGVDRSTVYNSNSQLTATILAADISLAGLPSITVYNPGYGTSNVFRLTARFSDVSPGNTYYTYINKIAERRVTVGCGAGLYCPIDTVLRDQMAVFIERSLGVFSPPAPTSQTFQDVPTNYWAYAFIEDFATRGITVGCSTTNPPNYCPGDPVTHKEMATFIIRALGIFNPPMPANQRFADVPSGHTFYAFIEEYARRGIWDGCGGGNFCPDDLVTREQMARILAKAFGW